MTREIFIALPQMIVEQQAPGATGLEPVFKVEKEKEKANNQTASK
jgi:hypothetical protein